MSNKPSDKPINTVADLMADLKSFTGDPKITPVLLFDGAQAWPLHVLVTSHQSAPDKFEIWIEKRLDREYVVARMRARLRESEADISELIEKIDRQRQRLSTAVQLRDQYKTLLAMGGNAE